VSADASADVVVVGAGHNSLTAAAYLARAGLEVLVLEARERIGGGTITEELTLPGVRHDTFSSGHPWLLSNPMLRRDEIGLAAKGLRYVGHDPVVVMPFPDGELLTVWRDPQRTAPAGPSCRCHPARGSPGSRSVSILSLSSARASSFGCAGASVYDRQSRVHARSSRRQRQRRDIGDTSGMTATGPRPPARHLVEILPRLIAIDGSDAARTRWIQPPPREQAS